MEKVSKKGQKLSTKLQKMTEISRKRSVVNSKIMKNTIFSIFQGKQSAMEGDAWVISFTEVENRLLTGGCRRKCLSILKALRDNHLELPGNPITSYILKTLVLYECEKHPREFEWDESAVGDRINGILLQLISCLQCKRCPHYFLPTLDLFKGKSPSAMENASKQVWRLLRELLTNTRAFEKL